jgi:endopolyphosphatase
VKDTIDFVVWTGDSARHDSDEKIPRTQSEVLKTNRRVADKFVEVFGNTDDPRVGLAIPVVPTFGNNDILPHNILLSGPNKWLKTYTDVWGQFIPEEQRHGFEKGGWYYVEVIPKKLAVFSLNTLYFFDHNAAVDGCALRSEPGFDHFEWLRIQLQFMRERGMKAILTGHVPPARTDSKRLWDETCWQKYTLWLQQYRDVVIGGLYGHMNIDHFMLQDTKQISILSENDDVSDSQLIRTAMDDELTIQSANDYLEELRADWSNLPNPAPAMKTSAKDPSGGKKKGKSKKDKLLKKMGGPWGERFQLTLVSPSLVPNYFPTLRIVEYNITGLDLSATWASVQSQKIIEQVDWLEDEAKFDIENANEDDGDASIAKKKKKNKKDKNKKRPKKPDFDVPLPPSKSTPPGPAYSPQSLTLLGYTQYFANLTHINNDNFNPPEESPDDELEANKWHEGKHKGKKPKDKKPHPKPFKFKVEYSTFNDSIYKLPDLTVRSYINLAHRIGQYKPKKGDSIDQVFPDDDVTEYVNDVLHEDESDDLDMHEDQHDDYNAVENKKHRKKKHHKQKEKNRIWLRFVRRAFVGTLEEEELRTFKDTQEKDTETSSVELHDGEM